MALSQRGADYKNQAELDRRDRILGEALADLASQIQAVRSQGNFGQSGPPTAPHGLSAIRVVPLNGFANVTLVHNSAPDGTRYVIEYSTLPNFPASATVQIDNGISLTHERYLAGKTLYFRAAPMFPASGLGAFLVFGSPTAVTF